MGLLLLLTALFGALGGVVESVPWEEQPARVALAWLFGAAVAAAWSLRVLEPPRDVRLGPISPILGGALTAGLIVWHPTAWGASLAVAPLATCAHLAWAQALRRSLADVPFELWEAAWLLGATHAQAVREVALPAAHRLRPRVLGASAWAGVGLLFALAGLAWTL